MPLFAYIQVSLPPPKPGVRKGCAAVLAAAQGGDLLEDSRSGSPGSDAEDSDAMDEDAGACAICYALHLPDPTRPDETGEWQRSQQGPAAKWVCVCQTVLAVGLKPVLER